MLPNMTLVVQNLTYKYPQGNHVLNKVSLQIGDGELVSLVGASGSGKSTLLHCIAGLIMPIAGSVHIDGRDVLPMKPHERGIGIMMQDQPLYEHLSVEKNIGFPLRARNEIESSVTGIMEQLQLMDVAQQKVAQCSGGERRRVALGRAIVLRPRVLLLDEPLVSLDEELRASMRQLILEVHETTGASTIFVTHDLEEAKSIAHQICYL